MSGVVIPDDAAVAALRNAVWYESRFRDDLSLNQPATLEDALHRAGRYIDMEEERATLATKYAPSKTAPKEVLVAKALDEYEKPRQHYDKAYQKEEKNRKAASFYVGNNATQQGNQKPGNKYHRNDEKDAHPKFCDYHKSQGHSTAECRYLQTLLLAKYKSGDIVIESDRPSKESGQGSNNQQRSEEIARQYLQENNDDQTKRQRSEQEKEIEAPSP